MEMSWLKPALESLRCADTLSSLPSSCTAGGNTCVPLYVLCHRHLTLLLCSFLNLCNQYGLLSEDAQAAARLDGQQPLDQNTRRLQKVQRFKREREIKAKLGSMQMKQMRIAQLQDEVSCAVGSVYLQLLDIMCQWSVATMGLYIMILFVSLPYHKPQFDQVVGTVAIQARLS